MTMNIFQEKGDLWISTPKYKDNYGNVYTKENGFFTPDEIDRRVKMGDLFEITDLEYDNIIRNFFMNSRLKGTKKY